MKQSNNNQNPESKVKERYYDRSGEGSPRHVPQSEPLSYELKDVGKQRNSSSDLKSVNNNNPNKIEINRYHSKNELGRHRDQSSIYKNYF